MAVPFELNSTYNFNTLAPAILGSGFKNVTVLGIIDYTTALKYTSPETNSVNVLPYLPIGTPSDPKKYTYILFKTEAGAKIVLALPWIDQTSVIVVQHQTISVVLNQVIASDVTKIREALVLLGFTSFTITVS
jgi:hypothetical protein